MYQILVSDNLLLKTLVSFIIDRGKYRMLNPDLSVA